MEDSASLYSMRGPPDDQFSQGTILTDRGNHDEGEESGWTTYLQDFSKKQPSSALEHDHSSFCSSAFSIATSSLISDAASRYHDQPNSGLPPPHSYFSNNYSAGPRKLSLVKKMRTKKITEEDPLEDTASSPVSSPKVDDCKRTDVASMKADDHFGPSFFADGGSSYHHHQGLDMETAYGRDDQMGLKEQNNNIGPCTSLKNRGLCLVPLSLFANYLG